MPTIFPARVTRSGKAASFPAVVYSDSDTTIFWMEIVFTFGLLLRSGIFRDRMARWDSGPERRFRPAVFHVVSPGIRSMGFRKDRFRKDRYGPARFEAERGEGGISLRPRGRFPR
jgi:hypothetical protein